MISSLWKLKFSTKSKSRKCITGTVLALLLRSCLAFSAFAVTVATAETAPLPWCCWIMISLFLFILILHILSHLSLSFLSLSLSRSLAFLGSLLPLQLLLLFRQLRNGVGLLCKWRRRRHRRRQRQRRRSTFGGCIVVDLRVVSSTRPSATKIGATERLTLKKSETLGSGQRCRPSRGHGRALL